MTRTVKHGQDVVFQSTELHDLPSCTLLQFITLLTWEMLSGKIKIISPQDFAYQAYWLKNTLLVSDEERLHYKIGCNDKAKATCIAFHLHTLSQIGNILRSTSEIVNHYERLRVTYREQVSFQNGGLPVIPDCEVLRHHFQSGNSIYTSRPGSVSISVILYAISLFSTNLI